ncbi:hypothetical protein POM88_006072 [Heracleum sosnowskyi]|uniref:Terpene synthase n=1 Tax=Heracleum sosnowskyi TaxID=360622 RepID=A0AAD8J3L3_9APIA|nr:hypothetical protein POM88_006072 [Heracleum sosnowskyi]
MRSSLKEEKYAQQVNELKEYVKRLIHAETDVPLAKMELLDTVQRLGLNYRFQNDVKQAVDVIYNDSTNAWLSDDLYSTALRFRILRDHGYTVSQDVFRRFKDDTGNFKANLCEDVKGLLSLYEASFFGFQGEDIIDEAKAFSATHLKNSVNKSSPSWTTTSSNQLTRKKSANSKLVDGDWFRQDELRKRQNIALPKVICLLITIDDLYDVYGSLEELELFTDFVERWDITEIDKLPKNLKTLLLEVFNTTNHIGFWTMQERDFNIIPYLRTSSEELARGDTLKAVQCYMNDTGASEAESKKYVDSLVHGTWKILNKDLLGSYPFSEPFLTANPNLARTAQTFYQYGDGLGIPQNWIKDLLKLLLVEPYS